MGHLGPSSCTRLQVTWLPSASTKCHAISLYHLLTHVAVISVSCVELLRVSETRGDGRSQLVSQKTMNIWLPAAKPLVAFLSQATHSKHRKEVSTCSGKPTCKSASVVDEEWVTIHADPKEHNFNMLLVPPVSL